MFLTQIERRQKAFEESIRAIAEAKSEPKTCKIIGVPVPMELHDRLRALLDKEDPNRSTLKNLAVNAIYAGIQNLERRYTANNS